MRLLAFRARGTGAHGGLVRRVIVASGLLLILISSAFAVLFHSIVGLRRAQRLAQRSEELLRTADQVEHRVLGLGADSRGHELTGQRQILKRWQAAEATFPKEAATLTRLTQSSPE